MAQTATMEIVPRYESRTRPVKDAEMRLFAMLAAPMVHGRDQLIVYRERDGTLAFREAKMSGPHRP